MVDNESRLHQVRQALAKVATINEVNGGVVFNGQEGRYVEKTYAFVSPINPTDISPADFNHNLLRSTEGVHDWDRENGRLFSHETYGNVSRVIEIQMFPDAETAVLESQALESRMGSPKV